MSKTYVVPSEISALNTLENKLELLKDIKRSFSVYRIDCGSCNGCEIEIFASITPMWDPERFGFKLVANPRHADILLCTGPVTRHMYYPLLRAYEAAPDPKIVIGFGACGSTGGIFHDCYSTWGGVDKVIPVDVWIPGCPPHPATIIHGIATAVGILEQKLEYKENTKCNNESPEIKSSIFGNTLFERAVMVRAREMMAYLHGRILYENFLKVVQSSDDVYNPVATKNVVYKAVQNEKDPRFKECLMILHNDIYLKHLNTYKRVDKNHYDVCFTYEEMEKAYD